MEKKINIHHRTSVQRMIFSIAIGLIFCSTFAFAQNRGWKPANTTDAYKVPNPATKGFNDNNSIAIPIPEDPNQDIPRSWTARVTTVNGQQVVILERQEAPSVPATNRNYSAAPSSASPNYAQNTAYNTTDTRIQPRTVRADASRRVFQDAPNTTTTTTYTQLEKPVEPVPYTAPSRTVPAYAETNNYAVAPATSNSPYEGRRWKVKAVSYGVASWYGAQYQGRRTANGEIFDMYQYTAAHRSIPFGSKVRVTNLNNNRSVIVRVNDRGPFAKTEERIIDLSMAAAQDIDLTTAGVAKVKVELLEEMTGNTVASEVYNASNTAYQAPRAATPSIEQMMPENFTVQIAATNDAMKARQRANNYEGGWVHAAVVNGSTIYRVNIGRFANKIQAESAANQLRNSGTDALVKQIQNTI